MAATVVAATPPSRGGPSASPAPRRTRRRPVVLLPEPLPPGVRVVHIGPHKTGTTAVQLAFDAARDALRARGVHYAGSEPQVYLPALGLTGKAGQMGGPSATERDWLDLVDEVRAAGGARVVMSSESLANAETAHIRRLASDLEVERVHVVRMLRRYDRMVPSQWQQLVARGGRRSFAAYVEGLRDDPDHAFWKRHGFTSLTQRWASVVGADRVSAVVVDEGDREWLLRVFEALLDLEPGVLAVVPDGANRSLTAAEVATVRELNRIRVARGWVDRTHYEFVRFGVSAGLRRRDPDPADGETQVPLELGPLLRERTDRDLAELERSGVRLVGDPAWLQVSDLGAPRPSSGLSVDGALEAVRAVVARWQQGATFPLEGRGPALGAALPAARQRRLTPAEDRLVAALEAEPWPPAVLQRFAHGGLVRWLRRSRIAPRPGAAAAAPERLDPRRVAVGLSGVIAQTDPGAPAGG